MASVASPASERYNLRKRPSQAALASTAAGQANPGSRSGSKDNNKHRPTQAEKEEDATHHEYEFGGPIGTLGMMVFFPLLFYYFYVCLFFYDGKFATPDDVTSLESWLDFVQHIASLVREHAAPTTRAVAMYLSLIALQLVLAFTMPGVVQQGLPVASLDGKTLTYYCNAYSSLYATVAIVGALHFTGVFDLADIIDLYGPLLTTASISGFALAGVVYVLGEKYRMSGNLIYDYFMGSSLNPRIGKVDIKMWAEIRISWILLSALSFGAVAKQYQSYGAVSPNVILFAYGTGLYLNSCAKGEQYIPQTWDMNYEKFGWLLAYWNFAGVPFSYAYPAIYMATHDPATYRYPAWLTATLFVILTVAHALFDVANGQKSSFKALNTNTFIPRTAFPQIPGTVIKNPKVLQTKRGKLLVDGLWAIVRKPNYTTDSIQAWIWALSAGQGSKIPYFYPVFHTVMLLHRNARDDARCARKYGDDWKKYNELVPYSFIPYVY